MSISAIQSRIGTPQLVALVLLLAFALQCVWFVAHRALTALEGVYIEAGLLHLEGYASANSTEHTALVPLLAAVAARVSGAEKHVSQLNNYRFAMRLPFLLVGLLLGASLWYVARRLYGNIGGYVALGLYCFSPIAVGSASQIGPGHRRRLGRLRPDLHQHCGGAHAVCSARSRAVELASHPAAGPFHHDLCRRAIFLLGIAVARAALHALGGTCATMGRADDLRRGVRDGTDFSVGVLWLSPVRLRQGAAQRRLAGNRFPSLFQPGISALLSNFFLQNGLGLLLLMAVTLVTFVVWKRTRFFGTAAPLLVGVLVFAFALRMHFSAFTFLFLALPFLLLFMAGISADLLESRYALAANAVIFGVLIANCDD